MRIAVFIKRTTFHKGYGGLETQNKLLCEGLAERGHDITIFSPKLDIEVDKKTVNGVDYVFIPCVFRSLFSSLIKDHWYNKSLDVFKNYSKQQGFDLILSQSSAGIGVISHKKEFNIPVVTISHGSILMEYVTKLQNISRFKDIFSLILDTGYTIYNLFVKQRSFIRNSDIVVTVSTFVANTLSLETFSPRNKFIVIHNGVDPSKFEQIKSIYKENTGVEEMSLTPRFLYLSQVQKSKGMDYLIKLVEDPNFKNIHIDVVGEGDYLDEFKSKVSKKGLNSFFTIHGKIEYEKVIYFYTKAYAFLFPTRRYEGFPMVLVEAMFNSLPVVAFNKGGVCDAVINGETGYLIRSGNMKKFKNAVSTLIHNHDIRRNMGIKSLEKAQKEFTIDTMLSSYEKVFEGIKK